MAVTAAEYPLAQGSRQTRKERWTKMEALFFVLIGAALFSQSWYMLGLYSDGRTVGVVMGGLGLLAIGSVLLSPASTLTASGSAWMLLTGEGVKAGPWLAQTMIMKTLILAWGLYAVAVAAQGLWDLDERAIGFYSVFLAVLSAVAFLYFAGQLELLYGVAAWLGMWGATLILTVLATMMFFTLSFTFNVMRVVTGWFILIGGGAVGAIGLAVLGTAIVTT